MKPKNNRSFSSLYDEEFYNKQSPDSITSAEIIVPFILEIFPSDSVVDVGCGIGTWLSVFRKNGVSEIFGIDGPHIPKNKLLIPNSKFISVDLSCEPLNLNKKFDLAISLEVAEHLPESRSDHFVDILVSLSDVIVFSAAVPYQGGVGHINEQWPEYWANKFTSKGYELKDWIRPRFWNDYNICSWYRQNMLIFIKNITNRTINKPDPIDMPLSRIIPDLYVEKCKELKKTKDHLQSKEILIAQLRERIEELKSPASHSPINSFKFFLNTIRFKMKNAP